MIRVGVLRGGVSPEYNISLLSGEHLLSHLRGEKFNDRYKPVDLLITKDGAWHVNGLPASMEKISRSVDVIWNTLHGEYGEDGQVQKILDNWNIPYTGSGALSSALGYNKVLAKEQFKKLQIKTPHHVLLPAYQKDFDGLIEQYSNKKAREVFEHLSPPWIVKPLSGGSSIGVHACKTFPDLIRAIEDCLLSHKSILVEEMILGKEATVGVIDNFRGEDIYTLPPTEIRLPKDKRYFDYGSKYNRGTEEICPGNFSTEEKRELERLAKLLHKNLGARHYSRSDFIISRNGDIYALEINTSPGLTEGSLLPKSLKAVGSSMPEFIGHVLKLTHR